MIIMKVTYKMEKDREEFMKMMYEKGYVDAFRSEPGNICYEYYLPKEHPDEIMLMEMWEDLKAQEVHQGNDTVKVVGKLKEEFGIVSSYTRYSAEIV